MTVSASYYDGKTSKRHQVTLAVSDGMAQVRGEVERDCPIAQLRVSERLNRAARKVSFPDGAYLEIIDGAAFSALLHDTGHRDSLVVRLQQSWRHALAACAALVAVVVLSYLYLLPAGAQGITAILPGGGGSPSRSRYAGTFSTSTCWHPTSSTPSGARASRRAFVP